MALDPRTPVVVGVGQVATPADAGLDPAARPEPLELMTAALLAAAEDCDGVPPGRGGSGGAGAAPAGRQPPGRGLAGLAHRQPGALGGGAPRLRRGRRAGRAHGLLHRGQHPQALMHDACLAISRGDLDVVLVTGAEAMYARALARRDPAAARWRGPSQPPRHPARRSPFGLDKPGRSELEMQRGLLLPIHAYPLFENALRAAHGWTLPEHRPASARSGRASATWPPAIRTPGSARPERRRRSSHPDPTTGWCRSPTRSSARPTCRWTRAPATSCARSRRPAPPACPRSDGCSRSRVRTPTTTGSSPSGPSCTAPPPSGWPGRPHSSWPGSGSTTSPWWTSTRASPSWCRWRRPSSASPVDDPDRPLTLTGGLTFGGGPGNNYTSHGIALAVGALRAGPGQRGARAGPGWYATKHSLGVYASRPPHTAEPALRLAGRAARGRRPAPLLGRLRRHRRRPRRDLHRHLRP